MPATIEAVRARATGGEIVEAVSSGARLLRRDGGLLIVPDAADPRPDGEDRARRARSRRQGRRAGASRRGHGGRLHGAAPLARRRSLGSRSTRTSTPSASASSPAPTMTIFPRAARAASRGGRRATCSSWRWHDPARGRRGARGAGRRAGLRRRHAARRDRRVHPRRGGAERARSAYMSRGLAARPDRTRAGRRTQRYWSPDETMTPEERDEVVLREAPGQVAYAWERSPFYRRSGRRPASVRRPSRPSPISPASRSSRRTLIRGTRRRSRPSARTSAARRTRSTRISRHVRNDGAPDPVRDLGRRLGADRRRARAHHVELRRPAHATPSSSARFFSLYMGSWGALAGTVGPRRGGVPVRRRRAGADGACARATCGRCRPSVFYGTPSYALHLARVAREREIDPASFGFRLMFFSGEPGAGIPATKRRIEETFGAVAIDTGSMAEMTPWMTQRRVRRASRRCTSGTTSSTRSSSTPETREPIEGDGEGVPVYTHLDRTSQPMIRLFSGDLARVTSEPCPCGRTYRRLPRGIYGRVDDMLIVRGVNVYPHAIEEAIGRVPGVGAEYRIVVERPDELDVLLPRGRGRGPSRSGDVAPTREARDRLTPVVTVRPLGCSRRPSSSRDGSSDRRRRRLGSHHKEGAMSATTETAPVRRRSGNAPRRPLARDLERDARARALPVADHPPVRHARAGEVRRPRRARRPVHVLDQLRLDARARRHARRRAAPHRRRTVPRSTRSRSTGSRARPSASTSATSLISATSTSAELERAEEKAGVTIDGHIVLLCTGLPRAALARRARS